MKKFLSLFLVLTLILSMGVSSFASNSARPEDSYAGGILRELGILGGDASGNLNEDSPLKREELVAILIRMAEHKYDGSYVKPSKPTFSDVPVTHWAFDVIEKANHYGLTTGIGGGKFGLGQNVTYRQALTFTTRLVGMDFAWDTIEEEAVWSGFASVGVRRGDAFVRGHMFELVLRVLIEYDYSTGTFGEDEHFWGYEIFKNAGYATDLEAMDKLLFGLQDYYTTSKFSGIRVPSELQKEYGEVAASVGTSKWTSSTLPSFVKELTDLGRGTPMINFRTESDYEEYTMVASWTSMLDAEYLADDIIVFDIASSEGYGSAEWYIDSVKRLDDAGTVYYLITGSHLTWDGAVVRDRVDLLVKVPTHTNTEKETGFMATYYSGAPITVGFIK